MRYLGEASIRFVGDEAKAKQYIPLARTILGGVINRGAELGSLEHDSIRRNVAPGVIVTAGYNQTEKWAVIDVSGGEAPKRIGKTAMYAVRPAGLLGGIFRTAVDGGNPLAPSSNLVGVAAAGAGAVAKFPAAFLTNVFDFAQDSLASTSRMSELDWYSTTHGRLYCEVETQSSKYYVDRSFANSLGYRNQPTSIKCRGRTVHNILYLPSNPSNANFISGVGIYGDKLIYMQQPKSGTMPAAGIISVYTVLLAAEGLSPGQRPVKAPGAVPVLIGTFQTDTLASHGLAAPWVISAGTQIWHNFSGSGTKAVRRRSFFKSETVGSGANTTITQTWLTHKEELIFSKDISGNVSFVRTSTPALGGIVNVDTNASTPTSSSTSTFLDVFTPIGGGNYESATNHVVVTSTSTNDTSTTRSMSTTGRMVLAYDYANDEAESIITMEVDVVTSEGSNALSLHSEGVAEQEYWEDPPVPPYRLNSMLSQEISYTSSATDLYEQTIDIESNLIYTAYGHEYTLPWTRLSNEYQSQRDSEYAREWPVGGVPAEVTPLTITGSNGGTVSMRGQQGFLTDLQGSWAAVDLRHGLFVTSTVESTETASQPTLAGSGTSNLDITRTDELYRCVEGVTTIYALPQIEGVGTPSRPYYSLSSLGYNITNWNVFPNTFGFDKGMRCRTVHGTSGSGADVSVNVDWVRYYGTSPSRYEPFGVGGSLGVSPDESCFASLTSYSIEVSSEGWTPYAALPEDKQAAHIVTFKDNSAVHPLTEKMWRSHQYIAYTQVPQQLALLGTVEWAGFADL